MVQRAQCENVQPKLRPLDHIARVERTFKELGHQMSTLARKWMRNSYVGVPAKRTPGMFKLIQMMEATKSKPKRARNGKRLKGWER